MASGDKYIKTILKEFNVEYLKTIIENKSNDDTVIIPIKADVYDVINAWDIDDAGRQHAIKKIMMPGQRHSKSKSQDISEAIDALRRDLRIEELKNKFNEQGEMYD